MGDKGRSLRGGNAMKLRAESAAQSGEKHGGDRFYSDENLARVFSWLTKNLNG